MTHTYRYDFNAKEHQPELGLNWHDYHARNYDASLGRRRAEFIEVWMNVDPLADQAPSWTPYRYGFNNPIRYIDPDGLFETRAEARSYRKEKGIKGRIQKGSDGNFMINDRKNGVSFFKDSSLDDVDNVIGRGEDGVIKSVFLTSSSSGGFYVQDGIPIWGSGTQDLGHKNGTRRGSIDMKKMPYSGPTGPKSSSKFAEWIRYMLTGLGLVDNMPVINKTTGVTPKVSNKSEESNNIFYTEVHYSHKEKGIRWGSRRHINNLTSYEQGQKDSAGIMDGTTHFRLNSLLKIDSVGIRNIQLKKP